jgi:hypothetical protein
MKNITLDFVHLCDAATADSRNKLSVLGIFTTIYLPSVPNKFARMTMVLSVNLAGSVKEEYDVALKLYDPKNVELKMNPPIGLKFKIPENFKHEKTRHFSLIFELINTEFLSFGQHKFVLLIDGEEIGGKEFLVEQKSN